MSGFMIVPNDRLTRWSKNGTAVGLLVAGVIFCCLGLRIESAGAYVLQGPHVLELMAHKLSGAASLRVHQQVIIEDPALSGEPVVLDETLSFLFPGQFRSEISNLNTRRIHVVSHGQALTIVDGKITAQSEGRFDRYKDLLLYNAAHALHKTLAMNGVDVGITSLGRSGDQIVYVIGAQYPDESISQLWVDKDQLLPLRWLTVRQSRGTTEPADRWEFIFAGWQKVDGVNYPFIIETFHNGQRIRRIQVSKVDANAIIDSQLVDMTQLRSIYPAVEVPAPDDSRPDSGVDEVQRTIEEFKKKFEP